MRVLLDPDDVARGLRRVAGEILERHRGSDGLVVVGVRRGGELVGRELVRRLREIEGLDVPFGSIDVTMYRDDAATALPNPRMGPSAIPSNLEGMTVILVDDVLYTGRTVRAAIDAILDYGRPRRVELAVLVDRGGRELPVQPDYFVRKVSVEPDQRVDVVDRSEGVSAILSPVGAPSVPPGP